MSELFHAIVCSDSLSLPRPWNQKNVDDKPEAFFKFEDTYPYLLRESLEKMLPDRKVFVSNMGNRASSVQRAANISNDLFKWMGADVTIVHGGIVDCWIRENGVQHTDLEKFEQCFDSVLEARQKLNPNLPLIVVGILPTNARMARKVPRQNEIISDYNKVLRTKLSGEGVAFIDVEGLPSRDLALMLHEDGSHLSRSGHQALATLIAEQIAELCDLVPLVKHDASVPEIALNIFEDLKTAMKNKDKVEIDSISKQLDASFGDYLSSRLLLAQAYSANGQSLRAFRSLAVAKALRPFDRSISVRLGTLAYGLLPPTDALPFIQSAYALDPSDRSTVFRLASVLASLKQFESCLKVCQGFLALHDDPQIRKIQDNILTRLGRLVTPKE